VEGRPAEIVLGPDRLLIFRISRATCPCVSFSDGMKKTFRPWDVSQGNLFPPASRDMVPTDHLSHFIRDLVRDELDLSATCEGRLRAGGWLPGSGGLGAPGDRGGGSCEQAIVEGEPAGMEEQIKDLTGSSPAQVSADAGYCSEAKFVATGSGRSTHASQPGGRSRHGKSDRRGEQGSGPELRRAGGTRRPVGRPHLAPGTPFDAPERRKAIADSQGPDGPGEEAVTGRSMPAARRRGASARLGARSDGLLAVRPGASRRGGGPAAGPRASRPTSPPRPRA
jgi:hypothetical protein